MIGDAILESLEARTAGDAQWRRECGRLYSGIPQGTAQRPNPHVVLFDGIGGEVIDDNDYDREEGRIQFTLASGSVSRIRGRGCIKNMVSECQRLFDDAEMSHADADIELLRVTPWRYYQDDDGYWEAQADYKTFAKQTVNRPATRD